MSSATRTRSPKGIPTGGQFAAESKSEPASSLVAASTETQRKTWGSADVGVGDPTPWGSADIAVDVADGIAIVQTPSHGGVNLAPERNRAIPRPMRRSNGWYEEDCEAHIPHYYFADEFCEDGQYGSPDAVRAESAELIERWFPAEVCAIRPHTR